jgi:hypothetical protein
VAQEGRKRTGRRTKGDGKKVILSDCAEKKVKRHFENTKKEHFNFKTHGQSYLNKSYFCYI